MELESLLRSKKKGFFHHFSVEAIQLLDNSEVVRGLKRKQTF